VSYHCKYCKSRYEDKETRDECELDCMPEVHAERVGKENWLIYGGEKWYHWVGLIVSLPFLPLIILLMFLLPLKMKFFVERDDRYVYLIPRGISRLFFIELKLPFHWLKEGERDREKYIQTQEDW